MDERQKLENIKNAISPYEDLCEGYGNSGSSGNSYVLGINLGIGVTKKQFSHKGSKMLDEINAFDLAEVDAAYIGQLNMSIVSSFCGPQGVIWGYDIAKHDNLFDIPDRSTYPDEVTFKSRKIKVFDGNKLVEATTALLGTVDSRRFPIRAGAHVPFAAKNIKTDQEGIIYSALAIGIAKNRKKDACLLMEDVGFVEEDLLNSAYEDAIRERLAKSIIEIGINQRVAFEYTFVAIRSKKINKDEIGCALVAAPYMSLAKGAVPKDSSGNFNYEALLENSLSQWSGDI